DAHREAWHIYHDDVRDGTIGKRARVAPPRHPPRRRRLATETLGTLSEHSVVTDFAHKSNRRARAELNACHRPSEDSWWPPFAGTPQDISTTSYPPGCFRERQPVTR